jgi:poly-gamma-glutamate capsule biosynthesis protein CapA/YwtB (metallophosphatase superfamily)
VAGIPAVGAGLDVERAEQHLVVATPGGGRVVIFSGGLESSGIPRRWAATPTRPGVAFISDLSSCSATRIAERILARKRPGDIAVVSLRRFGTQVGHDADGTASRQSDRQIWRE